MNGLRVENSDVEIAQAMMNFVEPVREGEAVHKFVKYTKIFPKSYIKIRRKIFLLAWYNSVYKNLAFTK